MTLRRLQQAGHRPIVVMGGGTTKVGDPSGKDETRLILTPQQIIDAALAASTADGCVVEISWQSSSLAPLFPVFAGHLTVSPTELRLEGYYAPPGGGIGAALDRAFLNIAARGTARWFLPEPARRPLDFISTRSETYKHPAALPAVKPGLLADDLARRLHIAGPRQSVSAACASFCSVTSSLNSRMPPRL